MKPLLVALMALVTVLAGASCGGDGDGRQPSSKTTATQSTDAETTPPPAPPKKRRTDRAKKRPPQRTKTEPTRPSSNGNERSSGRSRDTSSKRLQVERYLRENFGSGPGAETWYERIKDVSVSGSTTTVKTDIADNRQGKRLADEICLATNGTIPGVTDIVRVTGPGESILAKCVP